MFIHDLGKDSTSITFKCSVAKHWHTHNNTCILIQATRSMVSMRVQTLASLADMQSEAQIRSRITEADAVWKQFPWKLLSCQHSFEMRYRALARRKRQRKMWGDKKMPEPRGCNKMRRARLRRHQGQRQDEAKLWCRATQNHLAHIRIQMSHFQRADEKNTIALTLRVVRNTYSVANWGVEQPRLSF